MLLLKGAPLRLWIRRHLARPPLGVGNDGGKVILWQWYVLKNVSACHCATTLQQTLAHQFEPTISFDHTLARCQQPMRTSISCWLRRIS